jgi:TPR repeat protein
MPTPFVLSAPPHQLCNVNRLMQQGHVEAAKLVGSIYFWGQGTVIDYPRAMAAYKVGAEGGDASSQHQVGMMYCMGLGVDVDYAQALLWIEKAAAQDLPTAVYQLGTMYGQGHGVTPSFRRAREYYKRAIELGNSDVVKEMQDLTTVIQTVTSQRSNHSAPSSLVRDLVLPHFPLPLSRTRSSAPSWTSGWRSTARAART